MENVIDLAGAFDAVTQLLFVALMAVLTWAGNELRLFLRVKEDSELGQIIDRAIVAAVDYAESQFRQQDIKLHIGTKHEFLAYAANYLADSVPGALKHFGITPARVEQMIEARLNDRLGKADKSAAGSSG